MSTALTQLGGVGVWQVLQEVVHLSLGHLLQVDQGREAVELLQPLPGPPRALLPVHLALGVQGEEDSVEDIKEGPPSANKFPLLQLLHQVLWGMEQCEDSDDVPDELTAPHKVSAEHKGVEVVGLVLVSKLPLLQLLSVVT